jgi:L-malate glycosyltransferase
MSEARPSPPVTVLFIDDFPHVGGAEVMLLRLLEALDPGEFRPVLALQEGPLHQEVSRRGFPTLTCPLYDLKAALLRPWRFFSVWRSLARFCRQEQVRLVQAQSLWVYLVLAPVALVLGLPVVLSLHAFPRVATPWKRLLFRSVARLVLFPARRVTVVSTALAREVEQTLGFADRLRLVPNGVEREWLEMGAPHPQLAAWDGEGWLIGLFGRLHPGKGQRVLLAALHLLLPRYPQIRALFAGPECVTSLENLGERAYLERLAAETAPGGEIVIVEALEHLGPTMAACRVVVLPSEEETFGLTVLEAAMLGVPAVASKVGGLPEVIADGVTGLLVPPRDPEALAAALETLLLDEPRRQAMGQAARHRAERLFCFGHTLEAMVRVYRETLREARRRA